MNRLEAAARSGRQGRLADDLSRVDFIVLDELGGLPSAQSGGLPPFHPISRLYETHIAEAPPQLPLVVRLGVACRS